MISLEEGVFAFVDGRYRFAWLGDHGVAAMAVQLPPDSLAECSQRFGTNESASILP